jgi:hypothetical protein
METNLKPVMLTVFYISDGFGLFIQFNGIIIEAEYF